MRLCDVAEATSTCAVGRSSLNPTLRSRLTRAQGDIIEGRRPSSNRKTIENRTESKTASRMENSSARLRCRFLYDQAREPAARERSGYFPLHLPRSSRNASRRRGGACESNIRSEKFPAI